MMMMKKKKIVVDLGRWKRKAKEILCSFFFDRSPVDVRDKDAEKKDSKRKKLTTITTKAELKPMILSRFRMEK